MLKPEPADNLNYHIDALRNWVRKTVTSHRGHSRHLFFYELPFLSEYFPASVIARTRVVETEELPSPPLASIFGIESLRGFEEEGSNYSAITLADTYFIRPAAVSDSAVHFHELVHIVQWQVLGVEKFLLVYGKGLLEFGYKDNPLETMARRLTHRFQTESNSFDVEAAVKRSFA